jgi:molybdenum cofactor cytidylyltransferase
VLIMLADQAAVTADDLRRLVETWRRQPNHIVAAYYENTTGVPAIFPRTMFSTLTELRGDQGARILLHRARDRVVPVPIASAAIDIDTPEDLLRLAPTTANPQ